MSESTSCCLVCNDKSSGRHYGVLTCDGCRGFFKRSVRRGMGYVCREKSKCVVDLSRRNQCQACRMKKCLSVGMKKDAVQHERAPRLPKNRVHQFSPYPQIVDYNQISPLAQTNVSKQVSTDRDTPLSPPHTPKEQIIITTAEELYDISVHLLYETMTWARNIPTFTNLPFKDQALLLENSWCGLFLLNISQWNVPIELDYLIQIGKGSSKADINQEIISDLVHLQSVLHKFKTINLDATEFSCVKAIVLFNPDLWDIRSRKHIENLQDQAQITLQEHSGLKTPRGRFGRILLKLPLLSDIACSLVEKHFFKGKLDRIQNHILLKENAHDYAMKKNDSNDNQPKVEMTSSGSEIDDCEIDGVIRMKDEDEEEEDDEIEIEIVELEENEEILSS